MIEFLRRAAQPIFARAPSLRSFTLAVLDLAARSVLFPFRLGRPQSNAAGAEAAAMDENVDAFNRAAERYFADRAGQRHLLDKPFSEPDSCSRRLIDAGILMDALRVRPGDTVLELGAGTCWLSHFLNRYGCKTIAVDVSSTALSMGRALFERDPRTNWSLEPEFLVYDGHTLPVDEGSVEQVVVYDAYHHIPNPARLLRELRRVLKPDGIVAMSEPGRGHAASAPSVAESTAAGVLENELALEDIADLALACGFAAARVVVSTHSPVLEIDARNLRSFMGGRGFARYWKTFCAELDAHHYILLFAGDPRPTTRRPKRLRARIRRIGHERTIQLGRSDGQRRVLFEVYNEGDTRWLHAENRPGWTRLGAHLYRADASRTLVDFDWLRLALPDDVAPEQSVRLTATLPAIEQPGDYILAFDLVIEGLAWFAERGSLSVDVRCQVI